MRNWIFHHRWPMAGALVLVALLVIVGGIAAQSSVPHAVMEGEDCLSCHQAGVAGAPRLAWDHLGRSNQDCLQCHDLSGAPASEITHPVIGREDCLSCHGEGVGTTSKLAGNHVDYTNDECALCHFPSAVAAAESTATQERPHIVIGGNACVSCHPLSFVEWDLDMDCGAVCHTMQPYVDSLQDANLSAHAHAQEELVCLDCHEPAVLEQVHEGATDPNITELKERKFPKEFCFDCHVANEHTSYEEIIERTEDYTAAGGEEVNPHAITVDPANPNDPHDSGEGEIECSKCHKMHKESPDIKYCYATCHHERTFEKCSPCH